MQIWSAALVLTALQATEAITDGDRSAHNVLIGASGHVLGVDGRATQDAFFGNSRLMRQEVNRSSPQANRTGQTGQETIAERRLWAKRRGNLYSMHRAMHRAAAWSGYLYAVNIPDVVKNSYVLYTTGVFLLIGFAMTIYQSIVLWRRGGAREVPDPQEQDGGSGGTIEGESNVERDFSRSPEGLDEDIYGMGIAALIRDTQRFAVGSEAFWLRLFRLLLSLLTLTFCMTLQVFLLVQMKILVTSVSTNEARSTYETYEVHMYGDAKDKMTKLDDGQLRGKPEFWNQNNFDSLDAAVKDAMCQVPLSQPSFFISILLVWTLVCFAELRHSFDIAGSLIWSTPTIASMKNSIEETEELGDEGVIVVGLTLPIKILAIVFVVVPRFIVSGILLWLGCRWLTGTFGFSDVLQNAVALEFVLLLKDIFYDTITPAHNKKETVNTLIKPFSDQEGPSASIFLGAFTWGVLAIIWVVGYIVYFQQVLPDYQWDVHDACVSYLAGIEAATPDG